MAKEALLEEIARAWPALLGGGLLAGARPFSGPFRLSSKENYREFFFEVTQVVL